MLLLFLVKGASSGTVTPPVVQAGNGGGWYPGKYDEYDLELAEISMRNQAIISLIMALESQK